MKHGKRPTRNQKLMVIKAGLNPNNWLVVKNLDNELHLVHRQTSNTRILKK